MFRRILITPLSCVHLQSYKQIFKIKVATFVLNLFNVNIKNTKKKCIGILLVSLPQAVHSTVTKK